jgi:hypothetical protein
MEVKVAIGIVALTLALIAARSPAWRRLFCGHPAWNKEGLLPGDSGGVLVKQRCVCCSATRVIHG